MDEEKNNKNGSNKNGPIDYSKFFEREKPSHIDFSEEKKKKKFSLSLLKNAWLEIDKKTRIEIIVFLLIIISIIVILIFYFSPTKPTEFLPPPFPAEY